MSKGALSVYCECGADICPACCEMAHLPLSCARFQNWKCDKKVDVESIHLMDKTTRPCPRCKVSRFT